MELLAFLAPLGGVDDIGLGLKVTQQEAMSLFWRTLALSGGGDVSFIWLLAEIYSGVFRKQSSFTDGEIKIVS